MKASFCVWTMLAASYHARMETAHKNKKNEGIPQYDTPSPHIKVIYFY